MITQAYRKELENTEPYLPKLFHGLCNFESGIISCYEWGWELDRISKEFNVDVEVVKRILSLYGYLRE
ncbi:MAG: hypothetical protein AB1478_11000 [Nitrospirota bacterium]